MPVESQYSVCCLPFNFIYAMCIFPKKLSIKKSYPGQRVDKYLFIMYLYVYIF